MDKDGVSIVQAILDDREKGAARLVAEYRERLYAAAFGLCGDAAEAEDLVFRTFAQVVDKISDYREEQAFYGWMHTILFNYWRMSVRGKARAAVMPVGGLAEMEAHCPPDADGAESVTRPIDGEILREAVRALPPEKREVVVLHYFMEQPVAKIAKILSISTGTVLSRLYYARLALSNRLKDAPRRVAIAVAAICLAGAAAFAAARLVAHASAEPKLDESGGGGQYRKIWPPHPPS